MDSNKYQCAECGGVFEKGWTEEEAVAEMQENFGAIDVKDCVLVCDDCYQRTMAERAIGLDALERFAGNA